MTQSPYMPAKKNSTLPDLAQPLPKVACSKYTSWLCTPHIWEAPDETDVWETWGLEIPTPHSPLWGARPRGQMMWALGATNGFSQAQACLSPYYHI